MIKTEEVLVMNVRHVDEELLLRNEYTANYFNYLA